MSKPYLHWNAELTARQMFGDTAAICELIDAFTNQYPTSLSVLTDDQADLKHLSDEVHALRSLFGIFNAEVGYAMAVEMDRNIRAGVPVASAARQRLADELQAFSRELEHFILVHGA